jgi:Lar family restriction alleviation protein
MTTAPTELKPCPFCGHQPLSIDKWIGKHLGWQIFCHLCDASVAVEGLTEAEAIAAWNTRAPAVGGVSPYLSSLAMRIAVEMEAQSAVMATTVEKAEAICDILSALEPQAVDDAMVWQPIETAPKDGTVVLAVTVEAQNPKARLAWFEGEGWVRIWKSEDFVVDGPRRWWPTHWMPLPAPPAALQAAKEPSHD